MKINSYTRHSEWNNNLVVFGSLEWFWKRMEWSFLCLHFGKGPFHSNFIPVNLTLPYYCSNHRFLNYPHKQLRPALGLNKNPKRKKKIVGHTWSTFSLHWKTHPRASRCSKRGFGNNDLKEAWSFTFVSAPHANRAAANPLGVNLFKCNIFMLCKQLILASDNSPTSVTELYDKFICAYNWEIC